jgi:hypothetical protein
MIQKHCGRRLTPIGSHAEGYKRGEHSWKCQVCGEIFTQKTRQKAKEPEVPKSPERILMDGVKRAYYISASMAIGRLIEATPTGKERNILTQANVLLMSAESEFNGVPVDSLSNEGVPCWPRTGD